MPCSKWLSNEEVNVWLQFKDTMGHYYDSIYRVPASIILPCT